MVSMVVFTNSKHERQRRAMVLTKNCKDYGTIDTGVTHLAQYVDARDLRDMLDVSRNIEASVRLVQLKFA
jgi:hypothetical protein